MRTRVTFKGSTGADRVMGSDTASVRTLIRTPNLQRIKQVLIAAYLLLIPVGWSPFPWNIQWGDLVFVGLLLCWVAARDYRAYVVHWIDVLVLVYLFGPLFSLTKSSDLFQSTLEYSKHVYCVVIYIVFSVISTHRHLREKIILWCALGAGLLAGLGVLAVLANRLLGLPLPLISDLATLPYLGKVFRIRMAFQTPAFFSNYLTWTLPIVMALAWESKSPTVGRWWRRCIPLILLADFFTVSYSVIGLFAAGLFSLWRRWSRGGLRFLRTALLIGFLFAVVGMNAMLVVTVRQVQVTSGTNPTMDPPPDVYGFQDPQMGAQRLTVDVSYNFMIYYLLKKIALEGFLQEPLTGVGLGRFHELTHRAYEEGKVHSPFRSIDPHSTWLGRFAETGFLGGVPLILLWGGVVLLGMRLQNTLEQEAWMARAVLAGLVGLLVNSLHVDIMNFRFLWVGFALLRGMQMGK